MAADSRGPMMSTSTLDNAVTVASRAPGFVAASSPKKSPGPRVFTRRPSWVTATVPERIGRTPGRSAPRGREPHPHRPVPARPGGPPLPAGLPCNRGRSTTFSRSTVPVFQGGCHVSLAFRGDVIAPVGPPATCPSLCATLLASMLHRCCTRLRMAALHPGQRSDPGAGQFAARCPRDRRRQTGQAPLRVVDFTRLPARRARRGRLPCCAGSEIGGTAPASPTRPRTEVCLGSSVGRAAHS